VNLRFKFHCQNSNPQPAGNVLVSRQPDIQGDLAPIQLNPTIAQHYHRNCPQREVRMAWRGMAPETNLSCGPIKGSTGERHQQVLDRNDSVPHP